ncbi:TolC family protein [Sodalis endosymbiont of Spalangia cameroni]|uniref:TolC family protein n=1 Tax=Sodalis praecaptivus TaxID=1239307 RepID=UPI0031F93555
MLLPCRYPRAWLVLALLFSTAAGAEEMGLAESLARAERYSADLSATVYQRQALENQADTANQLPDPQLKFGIENVPVGGSNDRRFSREGMTMKRVGIMQEYISQTKRDRKADAIRAEADAVSANYQRLRAQLQRDTAQAWLDLALSQRAVDSAVRLAAESEQQIGVRRAGVAAGANVAAVLDARLALSAMRDTVTDARRDVALAQARLTQLTGVAQVQPTGALPRFERLPADVAVLTQGISQHPEILQARREADVAQARSAQSAVAALPDVGVEVYYAQRASGYDDMAGIMFTVDLPLFQSQRQDKDHAADRARTFEANDRLALAMRDHTAQLQALIARYEASQSRWRRQTEEVLPLQRQRIALVQAQYRSGTAGLGELLEARQALLSSELEESRAARQLAQDWAAIRYLIPEENRL